MYKKDGFITPSEHVNFLAKNLFGACGQIVNGAIAYLAPDGGGPVTPHTHATDHLFIVTQGEAKVLLDGQSESSAKTKRSSSKAVFPTPYGTTHRQKPS